MSSEVASFSAANFRAARARWLIALLAALPGVLWAADDIVLTARPGLCVLKDPSTRECVMGVRLDWRAPQGDYCLYQSGIQEPLRCWQQQHEGRHETGLASAVDVQFSLHQSASNEQMAQVSVRVLSLAQRRPERRRRRHAWAPL